MLLHPPDRKQLKAKPFFVAERDYVFSVHRYWLDSTAEQQMLIQAGWMKESTGGDASDDEDGSVPAKTTLNRRVGFIRQTVSLHY